MLKIVLGFFFFFLPHFKPFADGSTEQIDNHPNTLQSSRLDVLLYALRTENDPETCHIRRCCVLNYCFYTHAVGLLAFTQR